MKKIGFRALVLAAVGAWTLSGAAHAQDVYALMSSANDQLAANGKHFRIEMAETIGDLETGEAGQLILFKNVGNHRLGSDFVPGDSRRAGWSTGTAITYAVDNTQGTDDISGTQEFDEMRAATNTWQNVQCSNLPLIDRGNTGVDVGAVQNILGFGGTGGVAADVQYAGFLPANFFLLLGSNNILGVTFTFIWVDDNGNATDVDNNGRSDVAFREIYFNDGFTWAQLPNDGPGNGLIDLQSVALHEFGHGLSQAHFGTARILNNGQIQLSPHAVMNAGYIFGQQSLLGTDIGGHCSNWANWPHN